MHQGRELAVGRRQRMLIAGQERGGEPVIPSGGRAAGERHGRLPPGFGDEIHGWPPTVQELVHAGTGSGRDCGDNHIVAVVHPLVQPFAAAGNQLEFMGP